MRFDNPISVNGSPELEVGLENPASVRFPQVTTDTNTLLIFRAVVQTAWHDVGGLSIAADAIKLGAGESVVSESGNPVNLDLGVHAVVNSARHKVDGRIALPPVVNRVRLDGTTRAGGAFRWRDVITAYVGFDRPVAVTGTPQLALTIGSTDVRASFAGLEADGSLRFEYRVRTPDRDDDGIDISARALTTPAAAAIRSATGGADANLDLGAHAVTRGYRTNVLGNVHPTFAADARQTTRTILVGQNPTLVFGFNIELPRASGGDGDLSYGVSEETASFLQTLQLRIPDPARPRLRSVFFAVGNNPGT